MYLGASLGAEELGQGSTQLGRLSCLQLSQECILSLTPAFKLHPEKNRFASHWILQQPLGLTPVLEA